MKKMTILAAFAIAVAAAVIIAAIVFNASNTETTSSMQSGNSSVASISAEESPRDDSKVNTAPDAAHGVNQEEMSGMIDDELKKQIQALGLSSGEAEYQYKRWDQFGNEFIVCKDERYSYVVRDGGRISSAELDFDIQKSMRETETKQLSEDDFKTLAKTYMSQCLPAFDGEYTTIECSINERGNGNSADITLTEIRGENHVNIGTIVFSREGVLISFRGSNNSPQDFEGQFLSKEEITDIVYQLIQQYYAQNGLNAVDSMDDVDFLMLFKAIRGSTVAWYTDVYVRLDAVEGSLVIANTHHYILHASTGEIMFNEVFSELK